MGSLLDQRRAIRLLTEGGWTQSRGGKHVVKMVKTGKRPVTLGEAPGEAVGLYLWDEPGQLEPGELAIGAGEIHVRRTD